MSQRVFKFSKNYNGLEEAIASIFEDEKKAEYDMVLIPPEPSYLTDDEEGVGNDIEIANLPRDVPGTVEVFAHTQASRESDFESSDEETLTSKRRKIAGSNQGHISWKKCSPSYTAEFFSSEAVQSRRDQLANELKSLSPVQIFEKLFDEEVVDLIISNTKLYASQNNRHTFDMNVSQFKGFIGILLLTGYRKLPRERLYWSLDEDGGSRLVQRTMSQNAFMEIKRNIHLVDNNEANSTNDKMFKVRPFTDLLIKKFSQWSVFLTDLSIDEPMIKYFGHHPSKQFIRAKPVLFGYKNWALTSSTGYCYNFDVYCGKVFGSNMKEPLGSRVVKFLLGKLPANPSEHIVYFDNFFTSHQLLIDLRSVGYLATVSVHKNRTKKCRLLTVKDMKKKMRAEMDYRFDSGNEVLFVRWKYNSVCTMGTNFDIVEPMKVELNIPKQFQNYNRGMGGADKMDHSISLNRIAVRGKKWWWTIYTYMLDLPISNAWRLHAISSDNPQDQLQFRRNITRYLLHQSQKETIPNRSSSSTIPGLSKDQKKLSQQLRCAICHARVRWECKKCAKTLCIERPCFEKFHT